MATDPELPPRENFHLYLLAGQSNMAGRGAVEEEDLVPHPRVLALDQAGRWRPAADPIHFDKPVAGTGLGKTFAKLLAEARPGITIGLIPCAVGGSPIDSWASGARDAATGTHPWDDAMARVEIARRHGTLKGILWHQGESDCHPGLAESYAEKLVALVERFRETLQAPGLPFVAGQMGRFPDVPWTPEKETVDLAHRELPLKLEACAFASAEGLAHKGDKVHFDSASLRELGRRYARAYLALEAARVLPSR